MVSSSAVPTYTKGLLLRPKSRTTISSTFRFLYKRTTGGHQQETAPQLGSDIFNGLLRRTNLMP